MTTTTLRATTKASQQHYKRKSYMGSENNGHVQKTKKYNNKSSAFYGNFINI